jgi:SAM-dependent methyltransferase
MWSLRQFAIGFLPPVEPRPVSVARISVPHDQSYDHLWYELEPPAPPPEPEPPSLSLEPEAAAKTPVDLSDTTAVRTFVDRSNEFGGPNEPATKEWWNTLEFIIPPDLRERSDILDPLSSEYFTIQDGLYEAIVGQPYQEIISELTVFDREAAAAAHLAYPNWGPKDLNRHLSAMVRLVDQFDGAERLRVLEVGSGWGFSCEFLARLGYQVVGVDINPEFVANAARRSERLGLGIEYRRGSFEELPFRDEAFDVIFTCAAFHHARDPLKALKSFVQHLTPGGQVILSAEPFIPESMWPHWGLRTDALSIYCIASFGWWESGWTLQFVLDLFERVGLVPQFADFHSDLERYLIGRLPQSE